MVKIFYDVETTGVKHWRNSIIQLSGLVELDGEVVEGFNYLVKPHPKSEITPEALKVNGRDPEELEYFSEPRAVLNAFKRIVCKFIDQYDPRDKAFLVGFNSAGFDDKFLRKFFELEGDVYFGSLFWSGSLDVMVLASEYLKDRRKSMPSFKLKRVALELGIEVDKDRLHDAQYDVELTRAVYRIVTGLDYEI